MPKKEFLRAMRQYERGGYKLTPSLPPADEASQFENLKRTFLRSRTFKKAWDKSGSVARERFIEFILAQPQIQPKLPKPLVVPPGLKRTLFED